MQHPNDATKNAACNRNKPMKKMKKGQESNFEKNAEINDFINFRARDSKKNVGFSLKKVEQKCFP